MFGERLKELRTERHLTQKQLAEELGYVQAMIHFWEKGINEPTESAIRKTAIFFDVTTDYLLGLEDETGAKIKANNYYDQRHNRGNIYNGR